MINAGMYIPYYGNYRTRTFNEIWEDVESFEQDYKELSPSSTYNVLSDDSVATLFYLLSARYGNSHIASQNEYQFKMKVFSTIFMYGPTWEKRLDIQQKIKEMDVSEFQKGGKAIYNTALNPSNEVAEDSENKGTNTLTELKYINQQNTTNYTKSIPEAYATQWELLKVDVTKDFIENFKKLFLTIVEPELPLWYISDKED